MTKERSIGGGSRMVWGAGLLGFALGGFFDGILLHQILQWHHLLSASGGDLRFQVMADGYFHAAMYIVALLGLGLVLASRAALSAPHAGARFAAAALAGFGLWHIADAVLSHWLLGIHRIRMDSDAPLLWDLAWFAVFGLLPLWLGWRGFRRAAGGEPVPRRMIPMIFILMVVGAAALSAFPWRAAPFSVVVFRETVKPDAALASILAAGAIPVASDAPGSVWTVAFSARDIVTPLSLYGQGAVLVSASGFMPGCASWTSARGPSMAAKAGASGASQRTGLR